MTRLVILSAILLQSAMALAYSGEWINGANGYVGPSPVSVGREGGKAVYVCRSGSQIVGKLVKQDGKCYYGYYGKEYFTKTYQVLQDRSGRMRFFYSHSISDPYLVPGGTEQPGNVSLHICRVRRGNDYIGGKMVGSTHGGTGKCYYGYYGKEYMSTLFEALTDA